MFRVFKANKFANLIIITSIIYLLINPKIAMDASLNAISLWSLKVFPMLFPMFILTKFVVNNSRQSINPFSKFFCKTFNSPPCSLQIFSLSIMSGYPMGAKLINEKLNSGEINSKEAYKMLSFCSISGPAFMIGSIGVGMLFSLRAGIIITISNIIGSLINGIIYRGKIKVIPQHSIKYHKPSTPLGDIIYESIKSVLMIAGYMIISFLLIDILDKLNTFEVISNIVHNFTGVDHRVTSSLCKGIIEITRGISELATTTVTIDTKIAISTGLISFGGISIMMQTKEMFSNTFEYKSIMRQKLSQSMISAIVSILIVCLI